MTDQPSTQKANDNRKKLSLGWLIALVVGMCVVIALVGTIAENVGRDFGGEAGVWLGWAVTFIITLVICWVVNRQFGNPYIPIFCGLFVGEGLSKAAETVCRQVGRDSWARPIGFILLLVGFTIWMMINKVIANRQKS